MLLLKMGLLHHQEQFAQRKIQRPGDAPQGFHIGIFGAAFDHAQMAARNASQPAEHFLRHAALDTKLGEELEEYQQDKSMEEIADLLEVIRAVIEARGHTWDEVEAIRLAKARERGSFQRRLLLREVRP